MNQNQTPTFKHAFCAHFKCPLDDYPKKALFHCFYWHATPLAYVLFPFKTDSIREGLVAVDQLGKAKDLDEVVLILEDYRYQLRVHSIGLVEVLRIRISGRRVLDLFTILAEEMSHLPAAKIQEGTSSAQQASQ